jgi:hypothetical protein
MIDVKSLPERMKVWFTPQMFMGDESLLEELKGIAAQYDSLSGDMKMKTFDELMAEWDKIQAELWRRYVAEILNQE